MVAPDPMEKYPMTPRGAEILKAEIQSMREARPRISAEIEEARAHGDLSENAEYHAAKERQGLNEAKLRDCEAKLSLAEII
ncbi:MAG: transcription elongation factor GreA, partial [Polyangiaceae bacterium]|nr:transcription elongation factor GreA [Polyangiaceae bacterium]